MRKLVRACAAKFPENMIKIITTPVQVSFNNGWFSGFIDAGRRAGVLTFIYLKNFIFGCYEIRSRSKGWRIII